MQPWFRAARAALLAVLACMAGALAHAHLMPAGQGTVRIVGDSAYVVLAVPSGLLSQADDNRDGRIGVMEIERHRPAIGATVSRQFALACGATPARLLFEDLLLSHPEELRGGGADSVVVARRYQCDAPITQLRVRADLLPPGMDNATYAMTALKGELRETMLLAPGNSEAVFFAGDAATFARYLLLGAQHILAGADHLLFLLTVVVAAAGWRYWLAVVTAFTVAHSITLALAAWGLVQAPAQVVEPLIAASVALLALDNLLRRAPHLRQRLVLVFGCGLLHGLGIASVLSDAPIASHHMLASLAGFNLGVELGQMAFVAVVLALMQLARRLSPQAGALWLARGGSAAAAVMGCFWFVQRVWF